MKKKTLIILIVLVLVISALVFGYYKYKPSTVKTDNNQQSQTTENKEEKLTKQYVLGSISGEQSFKDKFTEYQDKLEEAVRGYKNGGEKPSIDFFIEKARYAQYLKQNEWAKEILEDVFNYYDNSSVAWNNLAKLYEEDKNYTKANEYYQKMIDTFGEKQYGNYYYYICINWMYSNDKIKTQDCYNKYKSFGGQDSQIEDYLK